MQTASPVVPTNVVSNAPIVLKPRISPAPMDTSPMVSSVQGMFGVKPEDADYNVKKYQEWQVVFSPNGKLNKEKCSFRRVLQHVHINEYFCVVDLPCGTWQCPSCGPGLKGKWEERMCVPMRASKHIEYTSLPSSEWKAYQKRLERQGYPYIRIEDEKEFAHLLVGGEVGGQVIADPTDRMNKLRQLLVAMPFDRTAISISKEWRKVAMAATAKKEKEWRILGNTKDGMGTINSRVKRIEGVELSAEFGIPYEGTALRRGYLYRAPHKSEEEFREILEGLGLSSISVEKNTADYRRRILQAPEAEEVLVAS